MCKKLLILTSFMLVFGLASSAFAIHDSGSFLFEYWFNMVRPLIRTIRTTANGGPLSKVRSTGRTTTAHEPVVICSRLKTVITRSGFQVMTSRTCILAPISNRPTQF
jgi:hypothetical protein